MDKQFILVGDVGGTNARLALCDEKNGVISHRESYSTNEFSSLEETVKFYLHSQGVSVKKACIAIACPVDKDLINMTNHHWTFSTQEMMNSLNFTHLGIINDFHAAAMAIPMLSDSDLVTIADFPSDKTKPVTVLGAGTGLGVAHILKVKNEWIALPGEGGHSEFAACTDEEYRVLQELHLRFGRVSAERVLSGPGLVNLYTALVIARGGKPEEFMPDQISSKAISGESQDCFDALSLFCIILGRFAGSLALTLNSRGGVYLAGGIVPRFVEFLKESEFILSFTEKGRFKRYVGDIPVFVITNPHLGLLGAGAYMRQQMGYNLNSI